MPATENRQTHIVVIGSINMDLVARVDRLPRAGETVHGLDLLQVPGGKGANQAVAAARLGARSTMIGRVGDDGFGQELKKSLRSAGVGIDHVSVTERCSSGVALIGVDQSGQNTITIVAGANGRMTPADVSRVDSVIASADAIMLQLEIPIPAVEWALAAARRHGVLSVLDTAPAPQAELPPTLFEADIISPNQTEAEQLTGIEVRNPDDAIRAAQVLRRRGARYVIIKLGEQGALSVDQDSRATHVAAASVQVVDTTAAGDAFTAAVALGFAEGLSPVESVRFGCAAGTLAATGLGAQQSLPTRAEVEQFRAAHM